MTLAEQIDAVEGALQHSKKIGDAAILSGVHSLAERQMREDLIAALALIPGIREKVAELLNMTLPECANPTAPLTLCAVCRVIVHTCERNESADGDYRCPAHGQGHELSNGQWVCSDACGTLADRAFENPRCGKCGGPHSFDTTLPSVVWNEVIRGADLPDYLCLTCIVGQFATACKSFTATLWGNGFDGMPIVVSIADAVATDAARLSEENTDLRSRLGAAESTAAAQAERIRVLEAALQVYADAKNWVCPRCHKPDACNCFMGHWVGPCGNLDDDEGADHHGYTVARAALATHPGRAPND